LSSLKVINGAEKKIYREMSQKPLLLGHNSNPDSHRPPAAYRGGAELSTTWRLGEVEGGGGAPAPSAAAGERFRRVRRCVPRSGWPCPPRAVETPSFRAWGGLLGDAGAGPRGQREGERGGAEPLGKGRPGLRGGEGIGAEAAVRG